MTDLTTLYNIIRETRADRPYEETIQRILRRLADALSAENAVLITPDQAYFAKPDEQIDPLIEQFKSVETSHVYENIYIQRISEDAFISLVGSQTEITDETQQFIEAVGNVLLGATRKWSEFQNQKYYSDLIAIFINEAKSLPATISAWADFLGKGVLGEVTPQQSKYLSIIHRNSNCFIELFNNLSAVFRHDRPIAFYGESVQTIMENAIGGAHKVLEARNATVIPIM